MIIDCFPFFNELDLLEIRLNELKDVVDVFCLSEATLTFTAKPKPLYFNENKDRFKGFNIHHTIISTYDGISRSIRVQDRGQKQRGIDAAMKLEPTVLILSDADEIPKAATIKQAIQDDWELAMLEMPLFYYYMNCKCLARAGSWRNPRLVRPQGKTPRYNITRKSKVYDADYWNGGWHFSFLNDIKYKLDSWTHALEFNKPPFNTLEHIKTSIEKGQDLFQRKRYQFEYVSDLSYLPQYVLANMDKFGKYIKEKP